MMYIFSGLMVSWAFFFAPLQGEVRELRSSEVAIHISIERDVVLNPYVRVGPRPALPRVVLKYDPHEVMLFPVVHEKMSECPSFRRDHGNGWIELQ